MKELGANVGESNNEDLVKDLIQCVEGSDVCWKETSSDTGKVFNSLASFPKQAPVLYIFIFFNELSNLDNFQFYCYECFKVSDVIYETLSIFQF